MRENILQAFQGVWSHKLRSFLTMLGIIIGIAAIIAILTVGDGLSGYITGTMSDLGASSISVSLRQNS
ncbi:ABC transporter permease, partial [Vibrio sp. FNV 38]|nr:ABC transporter permease [Vibrio sp. FNV 38]